MSDPYELKDPYSRPELPARPLDASSLGPAFGAPWGATPAAPASETPDFLFPENFDTEYRRGFGDRLTFHIGVGYLVGLTAGGTYGLFEGLKNSAGERQRIRVNAVLNSTGRRGPGWGNGAGCIAMMFSLFETAAYTLRETDDLLNVAAAGALTGGIFKSTAGLKVAAGSACALSALATVGTFISQQLR